MARPRASGPTRTPTAPPRDSFGAALRGRASRELEQRAARARLAGAGPPAADILQDVAARPGVPPDPAARQPSPLAAPASVHRVAMAIEVLRTGDRARLEIGFQGGAALQLDATRDGVALALCVPPAVARLAAAELPALVAALRQRGVRVARAEVRVAPEQRPGGRRPR